MCIGCKEDFGPSCIYVTLSFPYKRDVHVKYTGKSDRRRSKSIEILEERESSLRGLRVVRRTKRLLTGGVKFVMQELTLVQQ